MIYGGNILKFISLIIYMLQQLIFGGGGLVFSMEPKYFFQNISKLNNFFQ